MRIFSKIAIIMVLFIAFLTIKVNAASLNVILGGESEAKAGDTKIATVSIESSDQEILSVSGVIGIENIDKSSLKVEGINGWKLTYNSETGNFIVYNETGSKSATIMNITYTIDKNATADIKITASELNITTIDYEETQIENKVKVVTLKKENNNDTDQEKEPADQGSNDNNKETKNESEKADDTNKESATPTKQDTTKTKESGIPYTGNSSFIIFAAIVVLSIVSIVLYKKSKI